MPISRLPEVNWVGHERIDNCSFRKTNSTITTSLKKLKKNKKKLRRVIQSNSRELCAAFCK